MPSVLRTRDELTALLGRITAAMADCDVPGATAADRDELTRLAAYRGVVLDALAGRELTCWDPDAQAMADYLTGQGLSPVRSLGHSLDWRADEALEETPHRTDDDVGSLTTTPLRPTALEGLLNHVLDGGPCPIGEHDHPSGAHPEPPARSRPAEQLASTWTNDVLAWAQPVAGRAPERYVPPHPVTPAPRVSARPTVALDRSDVRRPAPPVTAHAVPERDRIWLDVPYSERRAASLAGAVRDPVHRSWYAPRPGIAALAPWARLPEILAGEDRTLGQGLFVDMIPQTSWFTNVRSAVSERDWFRVSQMVYRRAGQRCEACGAGADKDAGQFLESHERFAYRAALGAASGVQALRRLICLCSRCHEVTHWGRTSLAGPQAEQAALAHLMAVTGMDAGQASAHVEDAFQLWAARSEREWTVDLSLITDAGIRTARPKGDAAWAS